MGRRLLKPPIEELFRQWTVGKSVVCSLGDRLPVDVRIVDAGVLGTNSPYIVLESIAWDGDPEQAMTELDVRIFPTVDDKEVATTFVQGNQS